MVVDFKITCGLTYSELSFTWKSFYHDAHPLLGQVVVVNWRPTCSYNIYNIVIKIYKNEGLDIVFQMQIILYFLQIINPEWCILSLFVFLLIGASCPLLADSFIFATGIFPIPNFCQGLNNAGVG